jgi:hypothetical protein
MDETKLVIACHCESMNPIHFINPDNSIGNQVSKNVTYVDPSCDGKTWDRILPKSKQFIWGENCPVYSEFRLGSKSLRKGNDIQLLNILKESYRILEDGGIVLFPLESMFYTDETISQISNDDEIKSMYNIAIINATESPFRLGHYIEVTESWQIPNENIIIFMKKLTAGGRKKRLNRKRRKTKRNHTT